ncbi:hypothetical protein BDN70DRAFT_892583 [Pholiota conissans]|uniref:F-box domain-containing protein n=1 Tax=Pholiota conissans TaxID=109636 RepID=A0A9P6D3D2_9AGAR|nr:hypothetical protein BDN70DRAFT_892583 [Pholiota conissans]
MSIPSTLNASSVSASNLPLDILWEIFPHCLPESPLKEAQPSLKIAPMQLCHVSSSWRAAALSCPSIWLYLYYQLPIIWKNGRPMAWDQETFLRDIEFLKWWRGNHGVEGPFIRFKYYGRRKTKGKEHPLSKEIRQFLADYISTAQYLDISVLGGHLFLFDENVYQGDKLYPNLHSFITGYLIYDDYDGTVKAFTIPNLDPFHVPSTLRRLSIENAHLVGYSWRTPDFAKWSRLSHLSLQSAEMSLSAWYNLIRAVPNLQWGYFNVYIMSVAVFNPPKFTLPSLSTLAVVHARSTYTDPLGKLLMNLNLPVLGDLSVYISVAPAEFHGVAARINGAIKTIPFLKKLTIGFKFLYDNGTFYAALAKSDWKDVKLLPSAAPHLEHLLFQFSYKGIGLFYQPSLSNRLIIWREILRPSRWLDLENARNLRRITAIVEASSEDGQFVESTIRHVLKQQKYNFVFEIVPPSSLELSPLNKGWKTWGSAL